MGRWFWGAMAASLLSTTAAIAAQQAPIVINPVTPQQAPIVVAPVTPQRAPTVVAPVTVQRTPIIVPSVPQQSATVLKQGTEVNLETLSELNSQERRVGDRVELRVTDAVMLAGHTVIPTGTRAVGEVTVVKKKGMWGKSGRIEFRPLYLKLGQRQIPLSASSATQDRGKTGTAGVVASIAILPLAGFFVTGTSARIPPRTPVSAELDEDVPFLFMPAPPMQVGVLSPAQ